MKRFFFVFISLLIFGLLIFASIFPQIFTLQAKVQETNLRIQMYKIYDALQAYKLEHGTYPDLGSSEVVPLLRIQELRVFLKNFDFKYSKDEEAYLSSQEDSFSVLFTKKLYDGRYYTQVINSKKEICNLEENLSNTPIICKN